MPVPGDVYLDNDPRNIQRHVKLVCLAGKATRARRVKGRVKQVHVPIWSAVVVPSKCHAARRTKIAEDQLGCSGARGFSFVRHEDPD